MPSAQKVNVLTFVGRRPGRRPSGPPPAGRSMPGWSSGTSLIASPRLPSLVRLPDPAHRDHCSAGGQRQVRPRHQARQVVHHRRRPQQVGDHGRGRAVARTAGCRSTAAARTRAGGPAGAAGSARGSSRAPARRRRSRPRSRPRRACAGRTAAGRIADPAGRRAPAPAARSSQAARRDVVGDQGHRVEVRRLVRVAPRWRLVDPETTSTASPRPATAAPQVLVPVARGCCRATAAPGSRPRPRRRVTATSSNGCGIGACGL